MSHIYRRRFSSPITACTNRSVDPTVQTSAAGGHNNAVAHTFKLSFLRILCAAIRASASGNFRQVRACRERAPRIFRASRARLPTAHRVRACASAFFTGNPSAPITCLRSSQTIRRFSAV